MKVAAIYVTYNPDWVQFEKSLSIVYDQVDSVIIVDNSEECDQDRFNQLDLKYQRCRTVLFKENRGIAAALNKGFEVADSLQCDWALCFDQDSEPGGDIVQHYLKFIGTKSDIGQVGPLFAKNSEDRVVAGTGYEVVDSLITSGSMVNMQAFKEVGGFKEQLFIDSVDTEFSWNLMVHGFVSYRLNSVVLQHNLGVGAFDVCFMGKRLMTVTNHNYLRCYYIARNSLWVARNYMKDLKQYAGPYRMKWIKLLIKILLFESDKARKIKYVMYGVRDCNRNIFGKCPYNAAR